MATKAKKRTAGAKFVGKEVIVQREVTKIEKQGGVCVSQTDTTITLQFESRGRLITRTYPLAQIRDVSLIKSLD